MTAGVDPIVTKALNALDSFSVKLRNFIMLVRDRNVVPCVFEGEDHLYYGPRIDVHMPAGMKRVNFPMQGKLNVLKLYALRMTNSDVRCAQALYFVDKDFDSDRICNRSQLYMTPCYSIENLYLSDEAVSRVLRDCFKVEEYKAVSGKLVINDEYSKVRGYVLDQMRELESNYVIPLNAYILAGKQAMRDGAWREEGSFQYRKFTFNEYVEISSKKIKKKKEFSYSNITASLKAHGLLTEDVFNEKLRDLRSISDRMYFRGKNSFELFALIVKNLFEDAGKTVPKIFDEKHEVRIAYDVKTALGDLSSYADTPACLQEFLKTELASA